MVPGVIRIERCALMSSTAFILSISYRFGASSLTDVSNLAVCELGFSRFGGASCMDTEFGVGGAGSTLSMMTSSRIPARFSMTIVWSQTLMTGYSSSATGSSS